MKQVLLIIFLLFVEIKLPAQIDTENLEEFFKNKMKKANLIGLQAAFISNGELAWSRSYGFKNYETKELVNDSTLFLIASCSKPVTALAILKLCDLHKIKLDADINKYLPFKIVHPYYPKKIITTRMLLSHTSSLKDDWNVLDPLYTIKEGGDSPIKLEKLIKCYFLSEGKYYNKENNFINELPGHHWEYCNMGYALLGYLIEQVSGKSFEVFMQEEVFVPLQMNASYWFLKDIPHKNIARPHELASKNEAIKEPKLLPHYGYPDFPDGQLRTTVKDYSKVLTLLINKGMYNDKQYLKEKTVNEFMKIQFHEVNKWQAIAWNYNEFESRLYYLFMPRLPSHTGGDPGVGTVTSFDPKSKTGAVIFVNSPPNTFKGGRIFYLDMMKKLMKEAKKASEK